LEGERGNGKINELMRPETCKIRNKNKNLARYLGRQQHGVDAKHFSTLWTSETNNNHSLLSEIEKVENKL